MFKTLFTQDLQLDLLMEATNAPGLSAFNKAERRMYHLSKQMTGVVLPHDTYGSHLNNGKTFDIELEKKNFKAAGETLGEIWSELKIDECEVKAEYIEHAPSQETIKYEISPVFRNKHVFETQYMTAYLKCDDRTCCSPYKTSIQSFFPHRRLPCLIPISKTVSGMVPLPLEPEVYKKNIQFPTLATRIVLEETITPVELTMKYR